jgi:hypothetical protein
LTFHLKTQKLFVQPNIIKTNAEALLDASKESGLEVNSEKTKYWVLVLTAPFNYAVVKIIFSLCHTWN